MVAAGCAWGVYSLAGKGADDVLEANARSFIWALPAAMFLNVIVSSDARASARGLLLALIAGGVTSGLGLRRSGTARCAGLTATTAAVLQLSVPVIAAGGAVALLDETLSPRLVVAAVAVIGGVSLVLSQRVRAARAPVDPHAATVAFDSRAAPRAIAASDPWTRTRTWSRRQGAVVAGACLYVCA